MASTCARKFVDYAPLLLVVLPLSSVLGLVSDRDSQLKSNQRGCPVCYNEGWLASDKQCILRAFVGPVGRAIYRDRQHNCIFHTQAQRLAIIANPGVFRWCDGVHLIC